MNDGKQLNEATRGALRPVVFELCAETMQACLAARAGGADRIELCSSLSEGGLTPSHGLVRQAVQQSGLPIHVLLRPRGGDFVYSDADFAVMLDDLAHVRTLGVRGVVLGVLLADGTVDVVRTRLLVELASPLEVTFHRAFDETPSLTDALEAVIAAGCRRVLTAGGEDNALAGSAVLQQLVLQASGRIDVAVGGGVRAANAAQLARSTGARHFHAALQPRDAGVSGRPWRQTSSDVQPVDVAAVIRQLRFAHR